MAAQKNALLLQKNTESKLNSSAATTATKVTTNSLLLYQLPPLHKQEIHITKWSHQLHPVQGLRATEDVILEISR